MNKGYYAIEIINNKAYAIKKVVGDWILPVNGKAYRTLEKAQVVANELGINIEKVGNTYKIM